VFKFLLFLIASEVGSVWVNLHLKITVSSISCVHDYVFDTSAFAGYNIFCNWIYPGINCFHCY